MQASADGFRNMLNTTCIYNSLHNSLALSKTVQHQPVLLNFQYTLKNAYLKTKMPALKHVSNIP